MAQFELLREVARLYIRQQRETVACCKGTSLTQCWIVTELGRSDAMTLGELARAVGFDKSWTSRAVDSLVASGLVARDAHADDARKVRLSLTPKGRAHFESLNSALDTHAKRVMQRLHPAERLVVRNALALLHDALQQEVADQEAACAR